MSERFNQLIGTTLDGEKLALIAGAADVRKRLAENAQKLADIDVRLTVLERYEAAQRRTRPTPEQGAQK